MTLSRIIDHPSHGLHVALAIGLPVSKTSAIADNTVVHGLGRPTDWVGLGWVKISSFLVCQRMTRSHHGIWSSAHQLSDWPRLTSLILLAGLTDVRRTVTLQTTNYSITLFDSRTMYCTHYYHHHHPLRSHRYNLRHSLQLPEYPTVLSDSNFLIRTHLAQTFLCAFTSCLGRPTLVGKALVLPINFIYLFYSFLSIHRAQQPRSEWPSNVFRRFGVGKASTVSVDISPTPPLIFTGEGQKVRNLASFSTSLNFEPPAFENTARYPNSETKVQCCDDRPMSWPSLVKLGPHIPEKAQSVLPHPIELHTKTC